MLLCTCGLWLWRLLCCFRIAFISVGTFAQGQPASAGQVEALVQAPASSPCTQAHTEAGEGAVGLG